MVSCKWLMVNGKFTELWVVGYEIWDAPNRIQS